MIAVHSVTRGWQDIGSLLGVMGATQPPIPCPTEGWLVTSCMLSYRHFSQTYYIKRGQRRREMALMKWEPSEGLGTLQREMNRLLESFFGGSSWRFDESMTAPAVEVADTQDTVVVKAQVPGVSKEQLQVTVSEGMVTIKGER